MHFPKVPHKVAIGAVFVGGAAGIIFYRREKQAKADAQAAADAATSMGGVGDVKPIADYGAAGTNSTVALAPRPMPYNLFPDWPPYPLDQLLNLHPPPKDKPGDEPKDKPGDDKPPKKHKKHKKHKGPKPKGPPQDQPDTHGGGHPRGKPPHHPGHHGGHGSGQQNPGSVGGHGGGGHGHGGGGNGGGYAHRSIIHSAILLDGGALPAPTAVGTFPHVPVDLPLIHPGTGGIVEPGRKWPVDSDGNPIIPKYPPATGHPIDGGVHPGFPPGFFPGDPGFNDPPRGATGPPKPPQGPPDHWRSSPADAVAHTPPNDDFGGRQPRSTDWNTHGVTTPPPTRPGKPDHMNGNQHSGNTRPVKGRQPFPQIVATPKVPKANAKKAKQAAGTR